MTNKHAYITKAERDKFMSWLIINYGYERNDITDNSRVLSDKYEHDKHIKITKLTIYRWLKQFDKYIQHSYQVIGNQYIA